MTASSLPIDPNVSMSERVLTAAVGAGLFALAMSMPRVRKPLGTASLALLFRSTTGYCPAYAVAGVKLASTDTRRALAGSKGAHLDAHVTIARPQAEVYAFWRDVTQLARALPDTIDVRPLSDTESRWSVSRVGMAPAQWTARIINDEPGRLIAWRTTDDADIVSAGSVRLTETSDGRRTDVHVRFQYSPPLGRVGAALASVFGRDAESIVEEALTRIKQFLERDTYASLDVE